MKHRTISLMLLLLVAAALAGCSGSSVGRLNKEGNDAYDKQAYEEAWARYQAAQIEDPALAEPYYNAANTLYRQGEYAAALEQMNRALAFVEDDGLATNSFFNLGNAALGMQDAAAAVDAYIQALLRDPTDIDAKHNLELALAQLQQQQNQQQQNEQQQQDQQQQEQQDQQQQQDQQGGGEQPQDQQNPGEGEPQQQGDQPGDQQQQQEPSGEQQGEQQPQDGEQDGEQQQDPQGDQSPDGQQVRPGQDGQADSQLSEGEPDQDSGFSMMPEPGQRLSEDQARQLLAAIGRGSQTLQEALGQIFGGGGRPPEQDW